MLGDGHVDRQAPRAVQGATHELVAPERATCAAPSRGRSTARRTGASTRHAVSKGTVLVSPSCSQGRSRSPGASSFGPVPEVRLHVLMWHLAERMGRVRPDGVHLALPITHETLGHLVAARRPSVSAALGQLSQRGLRDRNGDGWVLLGDPPVGLDGG